MADHPQVGIPDPGQDDDDDITIGEARKYKAAWKKVFGTATVANATTVGGELGVYIYLPELNAPRQRADNAPRLEDLPESLRHLHDAYFSAADDAEKRGARLLQRDIAATYPLCVSPRGLRTLKTQWRDRGWLWPPAKRLS